MTKDHTSFKTLTRTSLSHSPSQKAPHYERLAALPLPHIESFNNMFENKNLIALAIADIGKRVIHDLSGNKLESICFVFINFL
jgi:predicted anti-sigma-YlaC factor YlaD